MSEERGIIGSGGGTVGVACGRDQIVAAESIF